MPMANIKITHLDTEENTNNEMDLKAEAQKGNLKAIHAFNSLRGGATATCTWKVKC
jgi:hypothetical protein